MIFDIYVLSKKKMIITALITFNEDNCQREISSVTEALPQNYQDFVYYNYLFKV